MTNKLYTMTAYEYITLLCEVTGSKWETNDAGDMFILTKDLYVEPSNSNTINGQTKTKK